VLAMESQGIPTYTWQPPARRNRDGVEQPRPPAQEVPTLFFNTTRDSQTGTIYLKVVNRRDVPQPVAIEISGGEIKPDGAALVLKADRPEDTNSITEPEKTVPVPEVASELGASFTRTFPPYSITVLTLKMK
jgi:alpha-N-arabinofuranosidase